MVLVIVIGPLLLFIAAALRDSNQTYDPLYKPRSFHITGKTYFLNGDCLFAYFLIGIAVFLIYVAITAKITDSTPHWQVFTALSLVALMMGALAYYLLYLNINYWRHTKDTTLSFDPGHKTVTVHTPEQKYVIREGDIEQVDLVSNFHTKLYYGYFTVKLKGGNELILTDNMPGTGAFFQYFRNTPHYYRHYQRFPIIK
ncbi:MAG TPA: hypothetical protein VGN67_00085 [Telluribacter sp.]|nr:hypothetical protein [Telluribacter sp.]